MAAASSAPRIGAASWRWWWGRTMGRYGLFALLLLILSLFLIWPIVLPVGGAFRDPSGAWTLRYFFGEGVGVLRDPLYRQGLVNALLIATLTTLLTLVMTLPLALLTVRCAFPGKTLLGALILVPLILPPFVGAIGLRAILGRFGALNALLGKLGIIDPEGPGIDFLGGAVGGRLAAVVVMEALHLYPILYLNIAAALANLDPSLEEAAAGLGAGRFRRFWRCTLPLIGPGIFAGSTLVFIWSFTELGTPLMFDYYTVTPVQIFWGMSEMAGSPRPYALVVVMLTVAVGLYLLSRLVLGRRAYAMQGKATAAVAIRSLRGWRAWAATGFFGGITLLALLPHLGVVLAALSEPGGWYRSVLPEVWTLRHVEGALTHDLAVGSIANSLLYATLAMGVCIALGLAMAYLIVRLPVRGGFMLDALGMLPLAVPGLVMAFGYVAMTLSWPLPQLAAWLASAGMPGLAALLQVTGQGPNPLLFLVIAYAIRRLPYILRAATAGLEQTSGDLEEAALNLGASRMTTIRRIVVPLIAANLVAGGILVFSFAMLEVSDSLVLATRQEHYPITKAIWELYNRLGDGPAIASAMGWWGMALLIVTLVGASVLLGRKLGAIFRI